ncbi:MAG: GTPase domain-containing protein, partial [Alphaproteobacteria bacterium]
MRVDERIEAALLDPGDVRPLLLGATRRELETLRRIIGRRGEYETLGVFNVEGFAAAIEARVAGELRRDAANAPFLHLSVWAAEKLGASAKPVALSTADAEVLRLSKGDALVRRVFHDLADKQAVVLRLAIAIARLRQKKLRRIRWWQPLLNLLIAKEKPVDNTILPPETLAFAGDDMNDIKQDDAWWEAIKNAGCRLPVSMWEDKLRDIRDDIGRFNIVVAGRTGVGKTTLIGAIFGQEVGDTLMGRPRTRGRIWYPEHPGEGDILRLCDTEGLEMERYSETLDGLKNEIKTRNASRDPFDHIHVAWLCIDEPSLTVQPGEEALVQMLSEQGIPTIAVLTKAGMAPTFQDKVAELLPDARSVMRVRAAPIEIEGQTFQQMGLDKLLNATEAVIPSAVEAAWHLASRNLEAMAKRAETTVLRASAAAGAAGAAPIPIADAAGVFGVQVGMIVAISLQMGVKLKRSDLHAMAITLTGALGFTAGGRFLAGL